MKLKYLVLSDIHLGHNINKTENIVNNLREFFIHYKKSLKQLDIIFLAGDIFDKLLTTSGKDFITATEWLTDLVLYCKDNNVMLRILEGTPSHDWKQAKVITTILDKFKIDINYKYIDTLTIEHIDKYNCNILYVPDEYKHNANDTYLDVMKLLKKHKLTQVDIAIMHGQFHYQLPGIELESSHTEQNYLDIVKYYISVGHIHTHSTFERIIAQGSFDRLAHNEEEPKGGVLIELHPLLENKFTFLTNTKSMIFKTIKCTDTNIEDLIKKLDKDLKKLPPLSNIRIVVDSDEFISKNIKTIKERYPTLTIKMVKEKEKINNQLKLVDDTIIVDTFSITRENIEELLDQEMLKHNLSTEQNNIYKEELREVI